MKRWYGKNVEYKRHFLSIPILGMLGEAVKNPEMAQRYVNTHTHNTHECKNIFFSKILKNTFSHVS